jgi:hypothetical protein
MWVEKVIFTKQEKTREKLSLQLVKTDKVEGTKKFPVEVK